MKKMPKKHDACTFSIFSFFCNVFCAIQDKICYWNHLHFHTPVKQIFSGVYWKKHVRLDRDCNPRPQEYRPCTLPLSYWSTCWYVSWYITKYLYPTTLLYIYILLWDRPVYHILPDIWRSVYESFNYSTNWVIYVGYQCNRWWRNIRLDRFEPRAYGTPFLHSTTELPNHISISLTIYIYHQIPVHGYSGNQHFLLFQQCFLLYQRDISSF